MTSAWKWESECRRPSFDRNRANHALGVQQLDLFVISKDQK
jgi:hypothetical protein